MVFLLGLFRWFLIVLLFSGQSSKDVNIFRVLKTDELIYHNLTDKMNIASFSDLFNTNKPKQRASFTKPTKQTETMSFNYIASINQQKLTVLITKQTETKSFVYKNKHEQTEAMSFVYKTNINKELCLPKPT